ncbi:MAG: hypothetical protein A2539_03185 [Elusimicrobia bacterium RIFOXYD2_FULL_34_15]|nr:MAG: hypothetical protein A2539_03185 [Elusimicrobia bacterium RIFOXYD2_FULL_34_15]
MLKKLFQIEIRSFFNKIKFISWSDSFKFSFLIIVGFVFLLILHQAFLRVLIYLSGVELIGNLLIVKLMSMIMLTFFAMLIFSNTIISFSTIFFSNDLSFLMSMPLNFRQIFFYKYIKTTIYSSWMVLVVFLPFLTAYGRIKFAGIGFYAVILLLLIPFFLIASSIGTAVSTIFMKYFPSQKTRDIFIILGIAAVGIAYIFARFIQPEDFLKADKLNEVVQYISIIEMPTAKYLPSWWVTSLSFLYISKQWSDFFFYMIMLVGTAFVFISIAVLISEKSYYEGWVYSREATGYKFLPKINLRTKGIMTVFVKDIKIFFRDTSQWSQMLLLFALVIVYLFNIYKLPLDTFFMKSLISFLNIGLAGFVLAAVSLRFIYPLVSFEGESFWIIRSAPIQIGKLLIEKFFMAFIPLVFFGVVLIGISNFLLEVRGFLNYLSFMLIILISISLTGLAVGFGALFPKFKVENISQVESSAGGMIYMIFSLFYVFLVIAIEAVPVRFWFLSQISRRSHFNWQIVGLTNLLIVVLSIATVLIPIYLGKKNLEALDV